MKLTTKTVQCVESAQGKFFRNWRKWSRIDKDCPWHSGKLVAYESELDAHPYDSDTEMPQSQNFKF